MIQKFPPSLPFFPSFLPSRTDWLQDVEQGKAEAMCQRHSGKGRAVPRSRNDSDGISLKGRVAAAAAEEWRLAQAGPIGLVHQGCSSGCHEALAHLPLGRGGRLRQGGGFGPKGKVAVKFWLLFSFTLKKEEFV